MLLEEMALRSCGRRLYDGCELISRIAGGNLLWVLGFVLLC